VCPAGVCGIISPPTARKLYRETRSSIPPPWLHTHASRHAFPTRPFMWVQAAGWTASHQSNIIKSPANPGMHCALGSMARRMGWVRQRRQPLNAGLWHLVPSPQISFVRPNLSLLHLIRRVWVPEVKPQGCFDSSNTQDYFFISKHRRVSVFYVVLPFLASSTIVFSAYLETCKLLLHTAHLKRALGLVE